MYSKNGSLNPATVFMFMTLCVFFPFSSASSLSRGHHHRPQPHPGTGGNDWDLLIFSQNWPRSVCDKWSHGGNGHSCYSFPDNTWTIHGLWPTKLGTMGPGFCDSSRPFRSQEISGIENDLFKLWAPVEKHYNKDKYSFWAHEWERHGTCAAGLPELSSEYKFFSKALQLNRQYNIGNALQQAGISPGNSYDITQIWDGVKGVLNSNPQVICFNDRGGVAKVVEIRLCFDKSFNLVDCDGTYTTRRPGYHHLTNCPSNTPILIP